MKVRVIIELQSIYCTDTEDVTGADTVYCIGSLTDGISTSGIATRPIWINNGETKGFPGDQQVIFDAEVEETDTVKGGITLFDEDYAKDWSRQAETVKKIVDGVSALLVASGNPKAVTAAAIIQGAYKVWDTLARLDEDDRLGEQPMEVPALGLEMQNASLTFKGGGGWWSSWDYTISYLIRRISPKIHVTVDPSTIKVSEPTQVTVNAVDAQHGNTVQGKVLINNVEVGATNTPFTHTFSSNDRGIIDAGPNYPLTPISFKLSLKKLKTSVNPYPVPLGQPVQVTINAMDMDSNSPVLGRVFVNSVSVGDTNIPFTYTFHPYTRRIRDPVTGEWIVVEIVPRVYVRVPEYYETAVDCGFPEAEIII